MNNERIIELNRYVGVLDFENYWGKKLAKVKVVHYISNKYDTSYLSPVYQEFENVNDKSAIRNAMNFSYELGNDGALDYWMIRFTTENNETYYSSSSLRCSVRAEDNGKVILGINGESERMYVSMASGNCSVGLNKIS